MSGLWDGFPSILEFLQIISISIARKRERVRERRKCLNQVRQCGRSCE
jgi:hypothetical protein